ncbi:MAG: YeeE/YedE family protein [Bacteroidales bacterium]|nr:YeeE/YedE family protein [Bacteroidales bacterium]MCF8458915.1 YeeE/YedE family protein [Bacteroidales bacterium]
MGPLITQGIIAENWNFILAFVIGIGFGFVLEQAGFSSSRKLAGVFYGYDFVVLRVFFTAAITAMTGMIFFHYFGWIDLDLVYVNPTFLTSAILGGVIMGMGFIVGGFCPGTSMCGAAIGKIDAMVFFASLFVGIFIFGETYSMWEELMYAGSLGPRKVFDTLNMSQGLFALLLIVVALVAFYITARIEKAATKVEY